MLFDARAVVNGVPVDPGAPAISLFDRGFLYADGVFEVLRTYGGRPRGLEDHLARMFAAANALGISPGAPTARWIAETAQVLSECPWPESVVRLTLTRGVCAPGVAPRQVGAPTRVVAAYALPELPALSDAGVSVITLRGAYRSSASEGRKTLEYLSSVMALRAAAQAGAADAIFLDADGSVIEAAAANVFVLSGSELRTTPAGVGLPGVTQMLLLEAARTEGFTPLRAPITGADLWTADEVFLSSSVREVIPVLRIDDHEVSATPGEGTRRLHARFRRLIEAR